MTAINEAEAIHRILILGSGYVVQPCIHYLARKQFNLITCISNCEVELNNLKQQLPSITCILLDVINTSLHEYIKTNDIIISLLPASMHPAVAQICIEEKKHMVTASYVSPIMRTMHEAAVNNGIILLNEIGLDPGIDHMSAMRIIEHVKASGGTITSFQSLCGGLPAPECANNNPLTYKFSWSPMGMLSATQNDATYKEHGKIVTIPASQLLSSNTLFSVYPALQLEQYPNRDSLSYALVYGIDPDTMFRGTLRYEGTCTLINAYAKLGLMSKQQVQPSGTWIELMCSLLSTTESQLISTIRSTLSASNISEHEHDRIIDSLHWLGILSNESLVNVTTSNKSLYTVIELFCNLLQHKLQYVPGERDLVVLHHTFGIKRADGKSETRTSSLVAYGGEDGDRYSFQTLGGGGERGFSAMARTVGLPVAIAAQLILDRKINRTGVVIPVTSDIYEPILQTLEVEGVRFVETVEMN